MKKKYFIKIAQFFFVFICMSQFFGLVAIQDASASGKWYYKKYLSADTDTFYGPYDTKEACVSGANSQGVFQYACIEDSGSNVPINKIKKPVAEPKTNPVFQTVVNTRLVDGKWYYKQYLAAEINVGPYNTPEECNKAIKEKGLYGASCFKAPENTEYKLVDSNKENPVYKKSYQLLAPIGDLTCVETGEGASNPNCITGNVGTYLNVIFKIAIGLAAALAVVMIIIHSISYMGNESVFGKNEAKSNILSSIGGLLIALGAYALLTSINPDLVGTNDVTIDQVEAEVSPDEPQPTLAGGKYVGANYVKGQSWPSDSVDRLKLSGLGIATHTPTCTTVGQTGCTTVLQLNPAFVTKLKNNCKNCDIVITEGTGFWKHSASTKKIHYPGGWTVDLRKTTSLTNYIHTLPKVYKAKWFKGSGANCYSTKDGLGIIEEGDHFHAFSLTGQCNANKQGL